MVQSMVKSQGVDAGERLLTQRDRRADGGARHVRVTRGDILIARRFGGIEMMIAAPVEAYQGVGLVTQVDLQNDLLSRVVLVHRDADLDVVLGETRDEAEAQDDWNEWAAWFGLARLAMQNEEWTTVAMPAGQSPAGFRLSNANAQPGRSSADPLIRRQASGGKRENLRAFPGKSETSPAPNEWVSP